MLIIIWLDVFVFLLLYHLHLFISLKNKKKQQKSIKNSKQQQKKHLKKINNICFHHLIILCGIIMIFVACYCCFSCLKLFFFFTSWKVVIVSSFPSSLLRFDLIILFPTIQPSNHPGNHNRQMFWPIHSAIDNHYREKEEKNFPLLLLPCVFSIIIHYTE